MRWQLYTAFSLLVACGNSTRPQARCPQQLQSGGAAPPARTEPHNEDAATQERIAEQALTVRRDAGYACQPARGRIAVTMKWGYTADDLAAWYLAVSCNSVVVPKYAVGRRAPGDVDTVVDAGDLDKTLQSTLAPLGLAAVTQGGVTVFFDNRDGVIEAARRGEPRIAMVPAPRHFSPLPEPGAVPPNAPSDAGDAGDTGDTEPAQVVPGVRRITETHYQVEAAFRDRVFGDSATSSTGARIVPSIKNGRANGFKLYAIRPSSWLAEVGFRNGDTVHGINGYELTTPDVALEVFQRVKDADHFELDITRRGKPILLVIDVK